MALSCIIVDDEPLAVKLLESYVAKTPGLELLGSHTDSVEAINAVRERRPNLLFLDIQMPDLNGMELARMLPEGTRVVFTTAFKEYAFESYEVSALDFLLKPIRYNKFLAAVEKSREWFGVVNRGCGGAGARVSENGSEAESNLAPPPPRTPAPPIQATLFLRVDGEYRQVSIADIIYVAGMKDYVMFYLDGERKPLITHLTMKAAEDMLPPQLFMRVHRSYIVCLDKIRKVDRNDCIYIGEEIVHVTDAYLPAFHEYLDSKIVNK